MASLPPRAKFPRPKSPRSQKPEPDEDEPRVERPVREDLVAQAALEAYGSIRHENRLADRALDFTLRHKRHLYSNERRTVAERVYALLRRQRTVDALLELSRPGFASLSTSLQDSLRLAASRVLHGESADTVATSMALPAEDAATLQRLGPSATKLDSLPPEERYAISASLPDFLARRFRAEFGADAEAEAEALNERAPLTGRVNTLKTTREALMERLRTEGVVCRETPLSPLGVFLETRINAYSLPAFRDGLFEIQDEGSQLLGMLVDPPPTRVADCCAGAGGKTLQLAPQMKNRGDLYALDIDARRLEELKRRARRASVHNVRIRVVPPEGELAREALADLAGKMDRVLVDAPCSGTGTYRRKPDARYRLTEASLAEFAARQKELLSRFAELVKPGGRIIYGTCSLLKDENEDVVDHFLKSRPDFSRVPVADKLGDALAAKVSRDGYLRLTPSRHGTDGFFGAILLRAK